MGGDSACVAGATQTLPTEGGRRVDQEALLWVPLCGAHEWLSFSQCHLG